MYLLIRNQVWQLLMPTMRAVNYFCTGNNGPLPLYPYTKQPVYADPPAPPLSVEPVQYASVTLPQTPHH